MSCISCDNTDWLSLVCSPWLVWNKQRFCGAWSSANVTLAIFWAEGKEVQCRGQPEPAGVTAWSWSGSRWPQSQDTRAGTWLVCPCCSPGCVGRPSPLSSLSCHLCWTQAFSLFHLETGRVSGEEPSLPWMTWTQDSGREAEGKSCLALPCLGGKNTEGRQIEQNCFYFSLHQYTVHEVGSLWRVQSLLNLGIIYNCFYCFTLSISSGSNSKTTAQIKCWRCSFPFYKWSIFVEGNENRENRLQPLPMMDCNKPMKLWECV